jgi:hypothetical protein
VQPGKDETQETLAMAQPGARFNLRKGREAKLSRQMKRTIELADRHFAEHRCDVIPRRLSHSGPLHDGYQFGNILLSLGEME